METKPHLFHGDRHLPHDWDIHKLMYEVPGFGEPNIERYLKSREQNKDELERITLKSRFEAAETYERPAMLHRALSSLDLQLQKSGAELIQYTEDNDQSKLQELLDQKVKRALSSENAEERRIGASMAQYASEASADEILNSTTLAINEYLANEEPALQKVGAQMIGMLQDYGERKKYQDILVDHIQTKISSEDSNTQIRTVELMRYIPDDSLPPLISSILDGTNSEAKTAVVQYVKRLRPQVAIPLLRQIFRSNDLVLKQVAAEATTNLFRIHPKQPNIPPDIVEAISDTAYRSLTTGNFETQKVGVAILKDVPDMNKLSELIKLGMKSEDTEVRILSIKAIRYLSEGKEPCKEEMSKLVLFALQSDDYGMQKTAVAVARYVPEAEKTDCMNSAFELVKVLIQSPNMEKKKHGAEMAYYLTHPKMKELFELIEQDAELLEALMFSRLYPESTSVSEKKDGKSSHQRVPFAKTGSEMTILRGGPLERRLLVRHIKKAHSLGGCEHMKKIIPGLKMILIMCLLNLFNHSRLERIGLMFTRAFLILI